ncbi:hypothetical protein QBA54_32775 [Streptomyces sp. B21-108]|uniref:hypothetical protein n=1 Tax=Streptomyces sp. B21-108 TaxID=3039419 RepID=UPI002FEF8798
MSCDPEEDDRAMEAALARMPRRTVAEDFAELQAARRAAEAAPWPETTMIPMPDYPYMWPHPLGDTLRFPCPLGCGWHRDEHPGRDAATERLVLPLDPEQLDQVLTAQVEARAEAFRARVEGEIADHFEQAHFGR